jgi:pimeloyl-ACP methyl ester carboxylesterase
MPFIETADRTSLFVTEWAAGRKSAALIDGATLVIYPGAGHGLYASDHDALNADILAFIHGRPLTGPPQPAQSQR